VLSFAHFGSTLPSSYRFDVCATERFCLRNSGARLDYCYSNNRFETMIFFSLHRLHFIAFQSGGSSSVVVSDRGCQSTVVSWTTMVTGLAKNGFSSSSRARYFFDRM
jgi:hypothetical protein